MRFDARELKPYSEPVPPSELKEGFIYFRVSFVDEDMKIPTMETLVFIGKDLGLDDHGMVYFQDYESYSKDIRFDSLVNEDDAIFSCSAEDQLEGVYVFERALDQLMACSLRRRGIEGI